MEESFPGLSISFTDRSERPRSVRTRRQKDTTCSVSGCDSICYARRICRSHYNRMWKYGRTAPFRKTTKKEEPPQGNTERLLLLKDRHKIFMDRKEKERRQHDFLSKGLDDFECAWGDSDRG